MDPKTLDTYNRGATAYAEKFSGRGPLTKYIDFVLTVSGKTNPRVLELGCGDGRDAQEICAHTDQYVGIDYSEGLVNLAKKRIPRATFHVADFISYPFGKELDVIFASASLLHVGQEDFEQVLSKAYKALVNDGTFYIGVKKGVYRGGEIVSDVHGDRVFYFYEESDIKRMAKGFSVLLSEETQIGNTLWLSVILQKFTV